MAARISTKREPAERADRVPPAAYSIAGFCRDHGISESMYYKIRAQGFGPREMSVGTRVLISTEAAAAWRRAREATAAEQN